MRVVVLYNDPSQEALVSAQDVLTQVEAVSDALGRLGHEPIALPCTLDLKAAQASLKRLRPDAVFNLVESLGGTDQLMYLATALLEAMGLAYTGASTESVFLSSNKLRAKKLLLEAGLPTAPWLWQGANGYLRFPDSFILKSVYEHASFAIDERSIMEANSPAQLHSAIRGWEARHRRPCFAEQFVDGREFNLSLLSGPQGPVVLPQAEIDFSTLPPDMPRIVGYQAKWERDSFAYRHTPRIFDFANSVSGLLELLSDLALRCWRLFGMRGYARVDFRVDRLGRPWILEINANPCLSPDAGFAAALERQHLTFDEAIKRILADSSQQSGSTTDEAAEDGRVAVATSPAVDRSVATRLELDPSDRQTVRQIVESTGVFSNQEVETAVELVDERLAKGPACGYEFVFAQRGSQVLGYACYGPIALTQDSFDLYWIAVRKASQGEGIASLLLRNVEQLVGAAGGRRLFIETSGRPPYAPARSFYEKCGYERVVEIQDFYAPGDAKVLFARWLS